MEGLPNHAITPQRGTAYTLTGLAADLADPGDYPVEAMCLECGRPVYRETSLDTSSWYHIRPEDRDGAA